MSQCRLKERGHHKFFPEFLVTFSTGGKRLKPICTPAAKQLAFNAQGISGLTPTATSDI
jgi:hypothetical protein